MESTSSPGRAGAASEDRSWVCCVGGGLDHSTWSDGDLSPPLRVAPLGLLAPAGPSRL